MIKAFKTLREIHRVFDAAADILQEDVGKPLCISNCGICCQHNTPHWMTIEAILAVSMLTGMGKLGKAIQMAEGWLLERHKEARTYEGKPVGWASPQVKDEFNALRTLQCPFLDDTMDCSIYAVRPLTCRAYGVTRDNADVCPRPPGKGETLTQRRYIPAPILRQKVERWREQCNATNKTWIISGFIPSLLYRAAREAKFAELVTNNQIASAKLAGVDYETTLMWQPQVDAARAGVTPELALLRR